MLSIPSIVFKASLKIASSISFFIILSILILAKYIKFYISTYYKIDGIRKKEILNISVFF